MNDAFITVKNGKIIMISYIETINRIVSSAVLQRKLVIFENARKEKNIPPIDVYVLIIITSFYSHNAQPGWQGDICAIGKSGMRPIRIKCLSTQVAHQPAAARILIMSSYKQNTLQS